MTIHERVGGSYKAVTAAHTKVGSTWKVIQEGWEKVGGIWKRFYGIVRLEDHTITDSNAPVVINFNSDGTITLGAGDVAVPAIAADEWFNSNDAGVGDDYEIRATHISGSFLTGSFDVWESLSTTRTWAIQAGNAAAMTIEIRSAVTDTVLASCRIDMNGT